MEQISLQIQNSLEEAISILKIISNSQEKGLILTDILINDIYFIRNLILSGKEEQLNNYFQDLNIIVDKAKLIKNNLTFSCVSKYGNFIQIFQQEPIKVIFQKINSILQNIKKQFPKQIDSNDVYSLDSKKIEQIFKLHSKLQTFRQYQNMNQFQSYHQLTVLFKMCNDQQGERESLLKSIASFILPTSEGQQVDYNSIFKILGIENNNQPISEKSLQLLNIFFQDCWLNRKYLLRLFQQGCLTSQNKQIAIEQYIPLKDLKLKICNGDFEGVIQSSQSLLLEKNKLQIIGERKVSEMNYQHSVNQICKYKLFTLEPYCIDCILLTPISRSLNCLLVEGQEINLNYGEQIKEYSICHDSMKLKLIINMEKETMQKNLYALIDENQMKQKDAQDNMQNLETETNTNNTSNQQIDYFEETEDYDNKMLNLHNQYNLQDREAVSFFSKFAHTSKIVIKLQKGLKTENAFKEELTKEFFIDNDNSFLYQLTNNAHFQFIYNKLTQQLKIKQIFQQTISNFAQRSFLEIPRNQPLQIQKDTVLFSQCQLKYTFDFK
ncbi:hypothetical protein TTHERM_00321730 (macronuclear) [Tetrahymena thermophila SB210]|uniref:Uncharacterized protein n=1 Tax=Tetrahymena thermophila (strain SB210) TaxID=312017 RepID=Q237L3_TETTS|nr:hypothetical protein TTHERM_00321730 [Tetrahymena thermophila SB210]EAR92728.2 hypothetical protein TTHERM_00321730 [Tetrahymena thermophila SB210]|eukprot:XP_001012973.2 hypothetical protein TTHERM_00321730 [Tetrahymena thermophila SB210]